MYDISTLRKKAKKAGFRIEKGFQHYHNGSIVTNMSGERFSGYMVLDLATGYYVWGSYDSNFDHLWTIDDVEEFLKKAYQDVGMGW